MAGLLSGIAKAGGNLLPAAPGGALVKAVTPPKAPKAATGGHKKQAVSRMKTDRGMFRTKG